MTLKKFTVLTLLISMVTLSSAASARAGLHQQESAPAPASAGQLTNEDVIRLVKAGLSEDLIINKIRQSKTNFDTSPEALVKLKETGVSDVVLKVMVNPKATTEAPPGAETRPAEPELFKVVVPDGTPVEIQLVENISSEAVQEGSPIDFTVVQPVQVNGVTVIERSAAAKGRIVEVKKARHWGRAGNLVWSIQDVQSVSGERIPLRLTKETKGGGSSGKVAAAVVVTAVLFWPAAPLWGLKKGKPAVIPAGTRVSSFVHGETTVEAKRRETEK
jgi:hypothetical protein